jgi:hypothetical protein
MYDGNKIVHGQDGFPPSMSVRIEMDLRKTPERSVRSSFLSLQQGDQMSF